MNDLERYFSSNQGPRLFKWWHYFEIYDRHFSRFRHRPVHVMEIGVDHGGSLRMWKEYFGNSATIHGVDSNERCKRCESENIEVHIGSQNDRQFLGSVRAEIPQLDIVIDDGGHTMEQQLTAFEELYPHVTPNGVYLVEDVHTSYWPEYGGGYAAVHSFVERSKQMVDLLNAWHSRDEALKVADFTRTTYSMHFYTSVVVFEKRSMTMPRDEARGHATI